MVRCRRDGFSRRTCVDWARRLLLLVLFLVVTSPSAHHWTGLFVAALKPVRNLHVTFRGQSYTIRDGVSTVGELTERFEELAGLTSEELKARVLWKGKILKDRDQALATAGVRNGDQILILPGEAHAKGLDVLGVCMFMLSNEETLDVVLRAMNEEVPESLQALQDNWKLLGDSLHNLNRKDVADAMRNGFDLAYHRLRAWWEHPSLRQVMHDPDRIESYRKVVSTSLAQRIVEKSPSRLQKAIQSPEIWRKEFQRVTSNVIRLGDTILDGLLDLLLDVLRQGQSASNYASPPTAGSVDPSTSLERASDPRMEDPSLANDLLYELSESDEDDDFDL